MRRTHPHYLWLWQWDIPGGQIIGVGGVYFFHGIESSKICYSLEIASWTDDIENLSITLCKAPEVFHFLSHSLLETLLALSVVPRSAVSASPENLLKMQILRPHSRLTGSETLQMGPSDLSFNKPLRWFWCPLMFENQSLNLLPSVAMHSLKALTCLFSCFYTMSHPGSFLLYSLACMCIYVYSFSRHPGKDIL